MRMLKGVVKRKENETNGVKTLIFLTSFERLPSCVQSVLIQKC
jgi:hypothetical protein